MEVGKKFENLKVYNQNMAKGLEDKMFFLEHLPNEFGYVFVDFGCADGSLIDALYHSLNPYNQYIGFDISEQMIDIARTKISESPKNVLFTSDWNDVRYELLGNDKKKVLILSSVVHEVYSYAKSREDIDTFWKRVLDTGFDYICVRDMMVPWDTLATPTPVEWINNIKWDAKGNVPKERREQFCEKWGPIENKHNALHYLLKYRWQINWNREVNENYFPIDIEDFLDMFKDSYNLDYFIRFIVPFIKDKIEEDFSITLGDTDFTHIKAVFSKKTN
jgi:SAM-dependent methyltransferase